MIETLLVISVLFVALMVVLIRIVYVNLSEVYER
jgi:hypothetical protein